MTLFEYLAIAFSLVFSFTALRLLAGLPYAAQPGRRYWIHLVMVCGHLCVTVFLFWAFWSYRNASWTLPRFLLILSSPALIYVNACALIPENAGAVESWRSYYYSVRRRYFIGTICWILVVTSGSTVMLQMPWSHPGRLGQAAGLLMGVMGTVSQNHRVHSALALFFIALAVIFAFTVALQPGSLAP